ncbi:hypothetical protein COLO4_09664 [Corchorus olitorius]|uniref:Bulb-type lectin domain-containing protein n=1 Tax=Corchorus olitorius TaxID=93759 RepID=A0A1R3KBD4_9ROSI|nr:hypothetical protein COLO4_09664 [Corchorus olitorius]
MSWQSPSGDFAFGFLPILSEENRFLLAIYYAKIPERTIVWYANGENPAERDSKVELTNSGHLVLRDPKGDEFWRSQSQNDAQVSHAAMLDTGNFVITSKSSNIWESFKYPTDTILPTQELDVNGRLVSALTETSYKKGKYQLRFNQGSLGLNQIEMFTRKNYNQYFFLGNGSLNRLIFEKSGYLQLQGSNGSLAKLAPENAVPQPELYYYRAKLNFDGVLTFESYPRNGGTWSAWWFRPRDICSRFVVEFTDKLGNGPCGYNSICEPIKGRPNCTCPPGFSFLDDKNPYIGCKQDYVSSEDCNPDGSTNEIDRFEFKSMQFADFPLTDYGILQPANELECKQSCLLDCTCVVAILQDPTLSKDGNGTCWKKKLPLTSGWFNRDAVDRTALFKTLAFSDL